MQTSLRTLNKEKITICATLLLQAMGIHNDIFDEDMVALGQDKQKVLALDLPYLIKIKEHALELPVFTQRRTRGKARVVDESIIPVASSSSAPPPLKPTLSPSVAAKKKRATQPRVTDASEIETELYTAPMSVSTMAHFIRKIKEALDWQCT